MLDNHGPNIIFPRDIDPKEVIDFVKKNGGLEYASEKMLAYKQEALQLIQDYPASPYKSALELMVNYVTERKK
jgi:octaprenyl-diphosphate synthase